MLLSSCVAYQMGTTTPSTAGEKVIYTDFAVGTAQSNRIFGLGGMRKDALILEARRQMVTARPLLDDEEYEHITTDIKHSFILMVYRTKVTMSADVVKHVPDTKGIRYTERYKEKVFQNSAKDSTFHVGQSIVTSLGVQGVILKNLNSTQSLIQTKNAYGEIITRIISHKKLFSIEGEWKGYSLGESIVIKPEIDLEPIHGTIIGIGKERLLVKDALGEFNSLKLKSIEILKNN